jgi:predicted alpha/beta hydrolase
LIFFFKSAQTGLCKEEAGMDKQSLQVDGTVAVALRVFEPASAPLASVVIGGAMGVPQDFYAPFAQWLAQQGFRVTTFDYRGHGDSLQGPVRAVQADLLDWARDYEAVITVAKRALPSGPLYLLGHSLGAQLPGLFVAPEQVDGLLGVATGSGYWRVNAPQLKRMVLVFWWLLMPLATWLCGYFPGRKLKMVGDLPAGVMWQWRRWCLNPGYSVGAEGPHAAASYGAVRFPVLALSISDDEMMSLRGTQQLLSLYTQAHPQIQTVTPADAHTRRIGHFGFFREASCPHLWPRAVAVLAQWAGQGQAAPLTAEIAEEAEANVLVQVAPAATVTGMTASHSH